VKVLQLADKNDVKLTYRDRGSIHAVRMASPFPNHLFYHWNIRAEPVDDQVDLHVSLGVASVVTFIPWPDAAIRRAGLGASVLRARCPYARRDRSVAHMQGVQSSKQGRAGTTSLCLLAFCVHDLPLSSKDSHDE
jgi:hypothetical protein